MNITDNEQRILDHLKEAQQPHDDAGEFGFSDVEIGDIERLFPAPQTAVGVLGSLMKKGLVASMDVNGEYNIFYLTPLSRERLGMRTG